MVEYSGEQPLDVDELRGRLRKMDDRTLEQFGRSAARMCTPEANHGAQPRRVFVEQLEEARAEWRRRHAVS